MSLPIDLDFVPLRKGQIEQIMLAPHEAYSVSSLAALRELSAAKISMTKSQAEVVLASFVSKGWLLKSKYGKNDIFLITAFSMCHSLDAGDIHSLRVPFLNCSLI